MDADNGTASFGVSTLDCSRTLARFIGSPANQLALTAAQNVAQRHGPGVLVIYGGSGYGKTHLLQAIAHALGTLPNYCARYITAAQFVSDLIDAIRADVLEGWRRVYEQCDVLILDDFEELEGRVRSLQEFFSLFNYLSDRGRQLVIALDRHPCELTGFHERLVSRLAAGLVVDLNPPDLECRAQIVRQLANDQGIAFPEETIRFLADRFMNSRHLQGAVATLAAQCHVTGEPITRERAEADLQVFMEVLENTLSILMVQREVAKYFHLQVADLRGKKRYHAISRPRQIAMWMARQMCADNGKPVSYPVIARAFGSKNHTTVIAACHRVEERRSADPRTRRAIDQIARVLGVNLEERVATPDTRPVASAP